MAFLLMVACLGVAAARPAVAQATVAKGIADPNIVFMNDPTDQLKMLTEIKQTGSPYVRIFVSWA
ncbi:MAG TPA: hypothetical protein VL117_05620, partial [Thermoleophilia bacterium]|nr:hypothetical protein [Thermoleophilia bacterium]